VSFRLKLFLALSLVAVVAVGLVAALTARSLARTTVARIERALISEARLAADLLERDAGQTPPEALDAEADRLGRFIEARVTFIAPDGRVLGDSAEDPADLPGLENHGGRPEVVDALASGLGISRRYSTTLNFDMLYVAAPTRHPVIAVVRFALPLTEISAQVRVVRRATAAALGVALAVALGVAWIVSSLLSKRLQRLAASARRFAAGAGSGPIGDGTDDEIGELGRVLNESIQMLGQRMADLDRSRGRLEAILSGMVEGVIVVDADGHVQLLNDSARRLLGSTALRPGELAEPDRYIHVIRHPGVLAQFDAAMAGRAPDDSELVLPSGAIVAARAVPLARGGAVLVLHDITRLRQADQVRRDFVANVSHELRTPLTAIRGYAEALRDEALEAGERERFLDVIGRHTQRMARMVQDLLRLARLDSGQEAVSAQPCPVATLFEHVITDLRPGLDAKGQRIVTSVGAGAESIVTDAAKLEEILRNLVENAINYAPEGTEIRVEAERRNGHCEFRVLDEGPGIPPADLTRVFERFYRVDKARARESGGTGLGLSIVKHLVELLGGTVQASARAGGGASFTVRVPGLQRPT
jgi:two-component system phosphate regulon sensor histidine kinase PhoR